MRAVSCNERVRLDSASVLFPYHSLMYRPDQACVLPCSKTNYKMKDVYACLVVCSAV